MADNETLLLTDKDIFPTDEYIFSIICEKKVFWQQIMNFMAVNYKDSVGVWNFYNDGKRWLFKMTIKKKTIFWAGILNETFRITFYLGNKAEVIIDNSDLPQKIKDDFKTAKRYGLIRPVTFLVSGQTDIDNILKMIVLKCKLK
jgi:hypothetical protein